jgi:hypothetical protein
MISVVSGRSEPREPLTVDTKFPRLLLSLLVTVTYIRPNTGNQLALTYNPTT